MFGKSRRVLRGLARPDGWLLQKNVGGEWQALDQAVKGNDYWQAYEHAASGTFDLIFNVQNGGSYEYRLISSPQ